MTDTPPTSEDAAPEDPEDTVTDDGALADAARVVAAFGGVRPMAAHLGVAATTIQGWKSRGHIPEARHRAVREAAAAANIDLAAAPDAEVVEDAGAAQIAETSADAPPPGAVKMRVRGWAGALIAGAGILGVAAASSPLWLPLVSDGLSPMAPRGPVARTEPVGVARAPGADGLSKRIATLESALESALEALQLRSPAAPDLTPRLEALSGRLDELAPAWQAARAEDRSAAVAAAASRDREVAALREQLAALGARLEAASGGAAMANGRAAAMVLAIGALDGALRAGAPYGRALAAVERFAPDDPATARFIAVLAPHAKTGIATRAQLTRRFAPIESARGEPLWKQEEGSWLGKALRKFDSVVSVRRIDGAAGAATADAARALNAGDLAAAAAALDGAEGAGAAWAAAARRRVAADRAFAGLRLRALDAFGGQAPPKNPAQ